ncbi:MAG: recombination protein RecR [Lachnospiraceae bacterium]|nr:recombination protein RecR [Lachnospiraceae bacterium]MBR4816360.1 recombination protein RecR [Lachnospiraceae bacterium]
MEYYSEKISRLISELGSLPGIGTKSAQRLAFHILDMPNERVERLTAAITDAKAGVKYCSRCFCLTDREICPICSNPNRDPKTVMVVETTRDMAAYERIGKYNGLYHVLNGVISPMLGIGPGDIKIRELLLRLQQEEIEEVVIATNSSVEGEATAMYLSKLIKPAGIKVSRIANGIPVGGDLEYIDEVTLLRALEGRISL